MVGRKAEALHALAMGDQAAGSPLDALGALQINAPASLKHPCSHPPFGPLVLKRGALPGSPPDQQNSLGVS